MNIHSLPGWDGPPLTAVMKERKKERERERERGMNVYVSQRLGDYRIDQTIINFFFLRDVYAKII